MFWIKIAVSALIIAAVSETAKRFSLIAAILASLPLVSILSMTWLYVETNDPQKVINLSNGILWAILPSMIFFIALPWLMKMNLNYYWALTISCAIMFASYSGYLILMRRFGLQ